MLHDDTHQIWVGNGNKLLIWLSSQQSFGEPFPPPFHQVKSIGMGLCHPRLGCAQISPGHAGWVPGCVTQCTEGIWGHRDSVDVLFMDLRQVIRGCTINALWTASLALA